MYAADLESALHYLLRVELATHNTLEGEELKIFKDFVTLVAKVTAELQTFLKGSHFSFIVTEYRLKQKTTYISDSTRRVRPPVLNRKSVPWNER